MGPPNSGSSGYSPIRGRPVASTRSSAVVQRDKSLIFAGDWYFFKDGILDVDGRFQSALRKEGLAANCKWNNDDYIFEVVCQPQDSKLVQHFFHAALYGVIREEEQKNGIREAVSSRDHSDDESDSDTNSSIYTDSHSHESDATMKMGDNGVIDSWKIQRLTTWMAQHGLRSGPESGAAAQPLQPLANSSAELYPPDIAIFQVNHTWRCETDFDSITNDSLQKLRQLTGCHFAMGSDEGVVYIGADVEHDVHMAILKLDNIRKYSRPKIYNTHLFYTEETQNFELSLKHLADVKIHKKRFFQTTLLDNIGEVYSAINNYNNLNEALTVRCAPWVVHKVFSHKSQYIPSNSVKLSPFIAREDGNDKERREWVAFCYNSKENASGSPLRHFSLQHSNPVKQTTAPLAKKVPELSHPPFQPQTNPKIAEIEKWNARVPKVVPRNPQLSKTQQPVANVKPAWDTYREWGHGPTTETTPPEQSSELGRNTGAGNMLSQSNSSVVHQEQKNRPTLTTGMKLSQNITDYKKRIASKQIATGNLLIDMGSTTNPLSGNYMCHSIIDEGIATLGSTFEPLTPARQSPTDTLQAIDEVGTRSYRNTTNQKAGNPKSYTARKQNITHGQLPLLSPPRLRERKDTESAPADPIPDFVEELTSSFNTMMKKIRGFRGAVVVQAEFGRILLRNIKSGLVADKDIPDLTLDREKLDCVLRPSPYTNGTQSMVSFTNKLTTSTMDMDDLVKLKRSDGTILWEPMMSYPWEVKYEFIFHEVGPGFLCPFTIEIDAERFSSEIKVHKGLGNIYVHGTKRHWDFRITASGIESNEDLKVRYNPLENALRESLYIPPNLQKPDLCFELSKSIRNKFKLDEIRVHRISQYRSQDHNSVLQISEIQALDTNARVVPGKDIVVFKAWLNTSQVRNPCQKLDSWCQASISCIKATEMLRQNQALELGGEASWTPASLARVDAVKALSIPACEMLKQMDAIGYHNENGVDRKARLAAGHQYTSTKSQAPEVEYTFW